MKKKYSIKKQMKNYANYYYKLNMDEIKTKFCQ